MKKPMTSGQAIIQFWHDYLGLPPDLPLPFSMQLLAGKIDAAIAAARLEEQIKAVRHKRRT